MYSVLDDDAIIIRYETVYGKKNFVIFRRIKA